MRLRAIISLGLPLMRESHHPATRGGWAGRNGCRKARSSAQSPEAGQEGQRWKEADPDQTGARRPGAVGNQRAPPFTVTKEHSMQDSTKDKLEGKAHELKGAVKEKLGQ